MTLQAGIERRRHVATPFLILVAVVAVVAGAAVGAQTLRLATNATAGTTAPVPPATVNNAVNDVSLPIPAEVESAEDCTVLDARSYVPFCGDGLLTRVELPRVTWQACHVMDETAYRQFCHPGDGVRSIQTARPGGR